MKIDSHAHIPPQALDLALHSGIANGLGAVIITDYSSTALFESLQTNHHNQTRVLDPKYWDVKRTNDPRILRVDHSQDGVQGTIYVGKGQEVESRQGHILALGIEETIPSGKEWYSTLKSIYEQEGIAVFAHLFGKHSGGCGKSIFESAWGIYGEGRNPLALEENAQYWNGNTNAQVRRLARELQVPLLFNSDVHARYALTNETLIGKLAVKLFGREYVQAEYFGKKLNTDFIGVSGENLFEGMKQAILKEPDTLRPAGDYNSTMDTVSWWIDSLRQNGWAKVSGTLGHAVNGFFKK